MTTPIAWRCTECGSEYTADVGTCGQNQPTVCRGEVTPVYAPSAQDIVDALRLVLTQDDAEIELVRALVERAPVESDPTRGVALLLELVRSGQAHFGLRDHERSGSVAPKERS